MNFLKKIVKKISNSLGFDIIRIQKSTYHSLLGIRNLPIKTIIDVGANEGQFAKMIERVFPQASIYCFEPIDEAFEKLSEWASSKNNRIKCFKLALGDSEKEIDMFKHIDHTPSSSILNATPLCESYYPFTQQKETIKVIQTTLDKAVETFNISLVPEILIKLDVQGYEDRVIKGGGNTFSKATACILEVCLDELYESQASFNEITALLYDMGFKYVGNLDQVYADDGHVMYFDAVFVKWRK